MDQLKGMQFFIRVVELGSLSAAAREMQITQPTVSKTISNLEDVIGGVIVLSVQFDTLCPESQHWQGPFSYPSSPKLGNW